MQKDTIVKMSSILQCQATPEGIRIKLIKTHKTTFSPTGNSKKPSYLKENLAKTKNGEKTFVFFNVSCKSSVLAKTLVSSKNRGVFDKNKLAKNRIVP